MPYQRACRAFVDSAIRIRHRGHRLRHPAVVLALAALVTTGAACHKPVVTTPAAPPLPDPAAVAARFETSIREGCYLCFADVLREFRQLPGVTQQADLLQPVVARASLLLLMRARDLGLPPNETSTFAETFASDHAPLVENGTFLLQVVHGLPWNTLGTGEGFVDRDLKEHGFIPQARRNEWRTGLSSMWPGNEIAAYAAVSLGCNDSPGTSSELAKIATAFPTSRSVRYRLATCRRADEGILHGLLVEVPRFFEAEYVLADRDAGSRRYAEAEAKGLDAWHGIPEFTAAAVQLAELEFKGEKPAESLDLASAVTAIVPDHWRAVLDRVKALSQLARHDEAIVAATRMIEAGVWFVGDAYYWRAWNEYQKDSLDQAMDDVQAAKNYETTLRVYLLAGVVRIGQMRWTEARDELLRAKLLDDNACDVRLYLGHVHGHLGAWKDSADEFEQASRCYASLETALNAELAQSSSQNADEWETRRIEKLKKDLDAAIEQEQASVYNAGVMFANGGFKDRAAPFATRAEAFPSYTDRARALLATLGVK